MMEDNIWEEDEEKMQEQHLRAIERRHMTLGEVEGLETGKTDDVLQEGFNTGFEDGAKEAFELHKLRGLLVVAMSQNRFLQKDIDNVRALCVEIENSIESNVAMNNTLPYIERAQEYLQLIQFFPHLTENSL